MDMNFNYLVKYICGSRRFGLNTETSDTNYVYVLDPTKDSPVKLTANGFSSGFTDDTHDEFFLIGLNEYKNIVAAASPLIIGGYTAPELTITDPVLRDFWMDHCDELTRIWPLSTYNVALDIISFYLDNNYSGSYGMATRFMGLIASGYAGGDMAKSFSLSDVWKERYHRAKALEVDLQELRTWYGEIRTKDIISWYQNEPKLTDLHSEFCRVIDSVIGGEC